MYHGWIVENTLFSIGLNLWIGAVQVEGQPVFLFYNNQVSVTGFHTLTAEQDTSGGDTVLMVAMAVSNDAEAVPEENIIKTCDAEGVIFCNRELVFGTCIDFGQQYNSSP